MDQDKERGFLYSHQILGLSALAKRFPGEPQQIDGFDRGEEKFTEVHDYMNATVCACYEGKTKQWFIIARCEQDGSLYGMVSHKAKKGSDDFYFFRFEDIVADGGERNPALEKQSIDVAYSYSE